MTAPPSGIHLTGRRLTALLGEVDPKATTFRGLADRIRLMIIDGRLPLGTRLPSERELATALGRIYTKESVFSVPQDRVYCDRSVVHKKFLHSDHGYFKRHVPAGLHAFFATERQAFHFGVHRGVKNRFDEQMLVENAYKREPTILRKLAIMGFESASLFKDNHQFNYGDALFNNVFESTMQRI